MRAVFSPPWSSGQAEGQINRVKYLKRQMYGRAKLDLMRIRVLHPNWSASHALTKNHNLVPELRARFADGRLVGECHQGQ